jgi:hypothetical protein
MNEWFTVDRQGLASIMVGENPAAVVSEIVQNAWDQNVTRVDIWLRYDSKRRVAELRVVDDDPNGFHDLSHAYTLFAPSTKVRDPQKRGRFNVGEKFVLARCKEARISTTTGTILFDDHGRHRKRTKREIGSEFWGLIRMSRNEFDATEAAVSSLLPPPKIATYFNNEALEVREPLRTFPVTLQTVVADDQGHLCKRQRKTTVSIHEPRGGEVPMVYEMGIPIVETNDKWHYNVGQKVPLNLNRDNVPPAFLRTIRTAVLNETHDLVETEDANTAWAREGMASPDCSSEAVNAIVKSRFGDHVVSFDLHDREANKLAVSKGYTVVHGGQMSAAEWDNVRRAGAILPAGKVTPSPKPYSDDPNAPPEKLLPLGE